MTTPRVDLYVARQLIELIEDMPWCKGLGNHEECMITPVAASWPIPNPLHDIEDPDWTPL